MVILPLLYRVWLHYHPQPAEQRTSLSDFLAKSAEACALQLIQTPLLKEQKRELDKRIDSAQRQIRRLCIAKELFARAVELENLADLNDSICLVELCHFLKSGETLERN